MGVPFGGEVERVARYISGKCANEVNRHREDRGSIDADLRWRILADLGVRIADAAAKAQALDGFPVGLQLGAVDPALGYVHRQLARAVEQRLENLCIELLVDVAVMEHCRVDL